jgi:antitoxin PrlF
MTARAQLGRGEVMTATLTSKGLITLPMPVRDALGLKKGDRVILRVLEGRAVLAKVEDFLDLAGSVNVSPEMKGKSWSAIKTATWRRRATTRK